MHMSHGMIGQYLVPAIVIILVMAMRMRGMNRLRPLKLGQLWVVPAFYAVIVIAMIAASPPSAVGWAVLFGGVVIGGLIGWQRGRFMHIEVDPATDSLMQRPSRAAMLLLVGLIVVRMGAKSLMPTGVDPMHGTALMVTDGLLGMALGLLSATRAEMYLRGRKLLAAAGGSAAALDPVVG
jgi:membrane protein CcdC involved in cytochrome C biogenesis